MPITCAPMLLLFLAWSFLGLAHSFSVQQNYDYLLGADDSGAGCIAGPLVCAAVTIQTTTEAAVTVTPLEAVVDSKRLTPSECAALYQQIQNTPEILFRVSIMNSTQVDEMGVKAATQTAFAAALTELAESLSPDSRLYGIVDGHRVPKLEFPCRPMKKADASVYPVQLASIVARAVREAAVGRIHDAYPAHGFDQHGGYPTRLHTEKLHQLGVTPYHRRSCKPVRDRMSTDAARRNVLGLLVVGGMTVLGRSTPSEAAGSLPFSGEIESAVPQQWDGVDDILASTTFPLSRLDATSDGIFYQDPRIVEHVDEAAVRRLTQYVDQVTENAVVLDVGASWTSHITERGNRRIVGVGMNADELRTNNVLSEWSVQDLNEKPGLPYPDNTFDVVLCQLSIDYFTRPLELCRQVRRVLKPNGTVHILYSNRLFLSKAVAIWTGMDDIDRTFLVGTYLHKSDFCSIRAQDLSQRNRKGDVVGDPLYVVTAAKEC